MSANDERLAVLEEKVKRLESELEEKQRSIDDLEKEQRRLEKIIWILGGALLLSGLPFLDAFHFLGGLIG